MLKGKHLVLYLILTLLYFCSENPKKPEPELTIFEKLNKIPGAQVTEITPEGGFEKSFELILQQPVNHQNPQGEQFSQRMYLHHIDHKAPLVIYTSGYSARANIVYDLTSLLGANQLMITHRYMADARPASGDWQYLTLEQAANDHHRIIEYFKEIYTGKRISLGRSKGGMAALSHRRFFPEDVDATVAWVAPTIRGIDDPRFDIFLEQLGSEECRNRIKTYQRLLLENRQQILPMIQDYMDNSPLTYDVKPTMILEYEVCEYPFAFWQVGSWPCETIPDEQGTVETLFQHLRNAGGFPYYSKEYMDYYAPVYYQAYTELGWYRLVTDHISDLIESDPLPSYLFFAPQNTDLMFKPEVMQDIEEWLMTEGNNIIYIYGADDPWTAAAIELDDNTNALKIVQPVANHNVTIDQLDNPQLIYDKLQEWLDIELDFGQKIQSKNNQTPESFSPHYLNIEIN